MRQAQVDDVGLAATGQQRQDLSRPIGVEKMIGEGDQSGNVAAICRRFGEAEISRFGLAEHRSHVGADSLRPTPHERLGLRVDLDQLVKSLQ